MSNAILMLREANELLRSAHNIATRGGENTNWETFQASLEKILVEQSRFLNHTDRLDSACCTARVYKHQVGVVHATRKG